MSKTYTFQQVKKYIEIESNSDCKLISKSYKNSKNKLNIQCPCGSYFKTSFDNFKNKNKRKCNVCSRLEGNKKESLKESDVKQMLKDIGYILLGNYCKSNTPITVKDKNGYIYYSIIHNLLDRKSARLVAFTNPYTIYNINLWLKLNNKDIKLLSKEYTGARKKLKWECLICGCIWKVSWNNLSRVSGCPDCSQSKGEKEIIKRLKKHNIFYIPQKEFEGLIGLGGGLLSYDFYLPQYNLLIEYQGEQHKKYIPGFHKSKKDFKKQLEHDRRKREYAQKYNIKLLEIWYYDFDKIEKMLKECIL